MAKMQPAMQVPSMLLEPYQSQQARLPAAGRHLIAATSTHPDTVVVYQAYRPAIAQPAVDAQHFTAAPAYSTDRMTWIKPGFMWMMYRSGWASKPGQEHILAVHLNRTWLFETLRSKAVLSVHSSAGKTKGHDVVVQWDPDHDYLGQKLERRAIQIGLRGMAAAGYAAGIHGPAVVRIEDITAYVCQLRDKIVSKLREAFLGQQQEQKPASSPERESVGTACRDSAADIYNMRQGSPSTEVNYARSKAAFLQQLLVPVEDVVQLDAELRSVLGMT